MPIETSRSQRAVLIITASAACVAIVRSVPHLSEGALWTVGALAVLFVGTFAFATLVRDVGARVVPTRAWRACVGLGVSAWAGAIVWMAIFSLTPTVVGAPVIGESGPWPPTTAMSVAFAAAAVAFIASAILWIRAHEKTRHLIHLIVVVASYVVVTELIVTSARQLALPFALCCWGWVALAACASPPTSPTARLPLRFAAVAAAALLSAGFAMLPAGAQTVLSGRLLLADALLLPRTNRPVQADCSPRPTTSHPVMWGEQQHGLVLVVIDTLRVDRVTPQHMPNLSDWAKSASLRFEHAYAPAPSTDRSLDAMLGLGESPNLFKQLQQSGVEVRAVSSHPGVTTILQRAGVGDIDGTAYEGEDFRFALTSHTVTDVALDQLAELRAQEAPFLLVVHYYDPHEYYVPNELFDFGRSRQARYDAEVAYTDHHLGRLLDVTADASADGVALMVTTDHGEELWDHGYVSHSYALYEESTRVLVAAAVPSAPTTTISFPVLNTVVRDATSAILLGAPLNVTEGPVHLAMREKRATVIDHQKWIWNGDHGFAELYDLRADPGEQNNLFTAAKLDAFSHCVAAFDP